MVSKIIFFVSQILSSKFKVYVIFIPCCINANYTNECTQKIKQAFGKYSA